MPQIPHSHPQKSKEMNTAAEFMLAMRPVIQVVTNVPTSVPVIHGGKAGGPITPLADLQTRARNQIAALPPDVRRLAHAAPYPVHVTPALRDLAERLHPER